MKRVPSTAGTLTVIPLHQLVNKVMIGLLPHAVSRNSFIINDIDTELSILADENMLAFVLCSVINHTISSTENECIRIEASTEMKTTLISVKTMGQFLYHNAGSGLKEIQLAAEQIGAIISISPSKSGMVATCSFKNELKAA